MTQYDPKFTLPMIIAPESMDNLLANVMAKHALRNLRVAETEKYAHVTYFFNGGIEKPFAGEDRELVQSKKVATYDLAPEMSAEGIGDIVERQLGDRAFDVIIVNFANADMVGAHLPCGARGRCKLDPHGRSRQCGDVDRSGERRTAHGAHDQSGAVFAGF